MQSDLDVYFPCKENDTQSHIRNAIIRRFANSIRTVFTRNGLLRPCREKTRLSYMRTAKAYTQSDQPTTKAYTQSDQRLSYSLSG